MSRMSQADYDWLVGVIRRSGIGEDALTEWENNFCRDWDQKIRQYGDRLYEPSDKQREILVRIDDKLTQAGIVG